MNNYILLLGPLYTLETIPTRTIFLIKDQHLYIFPAIQFGYA